ncbi:MAG: acetyltransferase [Opitutales bacterium]
MKKLLIIGAGGFGREMLAWCRQHPDHGRAWSFEAFLDDNPDALAGFGSFAPVRPLAGHRPGPDEVFVCGLGLPAVKEPLVRPLLDRGAEFLTFIHPSAVVGERVRLGRGVVVCPGAVLSADIELDEFVLVNLNSTVGHDARIGPWSTLSAQCDVTGHVRLGARVFLGSRATVIPRRVVGDGVTVGAGAVVVADVPPGVTVFGVPARQL